MKTTRDAGGLAQLISSHERISLGHFPTALEPLKRLGKWLGGPAVWVKRDDASGMGQGGNKVRALEFVLPEALAAGAGTALPTSGNPNKSIGISWRRSGSRTLSWPAVCCVHTLRPPLVES